MLLAVQRSAIRLAGTPDPIIEQLVNLLPDYSGGNRLHAVMVNRVKGALPGNYSQLIGTGPSFRNIFYRNYQPDPLLGVLSDTGLDDGWWSAFSIAVLCQSIQDLGSRIRGQMLSDKINNAVGSFNGTVRSRCARPYARVLAASYQPLINLLGRVNRATAKQQFHDSLLSNVINRQLWYQAGMWTSPDWEMFNQYSKYVALGASDGEVDTLIDELTRAGLPIPPQVDRSHWRGYAEALRNKPNVDRDDVRDDTAGPIQATTSLPTYGGGMPAQMPNGNCYEFTANSQPGNTYRQAPSGCCFTGDTEVLNGAGQPVALSQVKSGDTVKTRDGVATVAFVARPRLGGRTLYAINGGGPIFTDTHPFVNGAEPQGTETPPIALSLNPTRLTWAVPTLSECGVGQLQIGSLLLGRRPGSGDSFPVKVNVLGQAPEHPAEDFLYDLNLEVSTGGRQEFWAGKGEQFYLVSPEFPVLDEATAAAIAVTGTMEGLIAAGGPQLSKWVPNLRELVHQFAAGIFDIGLDHALHTVPSFGLPTPKEPLFERIDRLYRGLGSVNPAGADAIATLFDGLLSSIGPWLIASIALGWRKPPDTEGNVVVVTVFDMELTPQTPILADKLIRIDASVSGGGDTVSTPMWNRGGRANTRFHHYFDQLIHLERGRLGELTNLSFSVTIDSAPIPSLFGSAPLVLGEAGHRFQSAQLVDASGTVIGAIRFDSRLLSRENAQEELSQSGLWTEEAAQAYANALGAAMVEPILKTLDELAGVKPA